MNPLARVLTAVDFSEPARAAFDHALVLSRTHHAELTVVHAVPVDQTFNWQARERIAMIQALRQAAEAAGVRFKVSVQQGDPAGVILLHARARRPDLVVLGTHQRTGFARFRLGSVAKTVTRRATQPVLIVPASPGARTAESVMSFNSILVAIDFSPASLRALDHALTLAQQSGGRITLLHVLEDFPYESVYSGSRAFRLIGDYRARVDKFERELRALVPPDAHNWCEVEMEVVSGIPHDAIVATAGARKADLVVIGRPRRTSLDRIVMASTVSAVLRRARCPVLAVPGPADVTEVASRAISADRYDHEGLALLTPRHIEAL